MTFTINVPVFPMRKEIDARRGGQTTGASGGQNRRRSRDADGFLELELLPLDQIDAVQSVRPRERKGLLSLICAGRS